MSIEDEKLNISVIDNGCGLPRKDRRKLVEPYITTRAKGTGLGLAIVRKIIEQHHGTLELKDAKVENGSGSGAAISIILPLTTPDQKREGVSDPTHRSTENNNDQTTNLHGVKDAV